MLIYDKDKLSKHITLETNPRQSSFIFRCGADVNFPPLPAGLEVMKTYRGIVQQYFLF